MTIDELNALTTLTAADEVPVWDSEESDEPTKKITASNLAASVKSLASLPNTTEMNTAIAQSTASVAHTVYKEIQSGATWYLNHTSAVLFWCDRGGMWTEGTAQRTLDVIKANSQIDVTRTSASKIKIKNNYSYGATIVAISAIAPTFTES